MRFDELMTKIFTSPKFIFTIIIINAAIVFVEETLPYNLAINIADMVCTIIFIIEMIVKMKVSGFKGYWKSRWNMFDGTLVIISLPSLVEFFYPIAGYNISMVLVFRLLRVMRVFRITRIFKGKKVLKAILLNFKKALQDSAPIFLFYLVIILTFGVVNCSMFKDIAPQYFSTPLNSIYTVFRLFTIEGWYEIPDAMAGTTMPWAVHVIRLYFVILLVAGGIIGMSLINSIFVDAMVSDNNDDLKRKLNDMEKKLDLLLAEKNKQETLDNTDSVQQDEKH